MVLWVANGDGGVHVGTNRLGRVFLNHLLRRLGELFAGLMSTLNPSSSLAKKVFSAADKSVEIPPTSGVAQGGTPELRHVVLEDAAASFDEPERGSGSFWYKLIHSTSYMYIIILIQGLAQLISSGALLNSSHFFISHVKESGMKSTLVMDYLVVVLCLSRVLFLILGHVLFKICCIFSPTIHIMYSLVCKTVIFFGFAWIAYINTLSGTLFLVSALTLAFLGSFMGVVSFMGTYCFLATMKPVFSQALCIGQTSAGLVMSLTKVIVLLTTSSETGDMNIALYFIITASVTLLSALLFLTIRKSYTDQKFQFIPTSLICDQDTDPTSEAVLKGDSIQSLTPASLPKLLHQPQPKRIHIYSNNSNVSTNSFAAKPALQQRGSKYDVYGRRNFSIDTMLVVRSFAESPLMLDTWEDLKRRNSSESKATQVDDVDTELGASKAEVRPSLLHHCRQMLGLFMHNKSFYLCILAHYTQSIFLVPNFCYITEANHKTGVLYTATMFPVFSYFLYHAAEWGGKLILSFDRFRCRNMTWLWIGVVATFALFPLFMAGNVKVILNAFGRPSKPWISSDEFFLVLLCVFGLLHGYLSTCLVMLTPEIQVALDYSPQSTSNDWPQLRNVDKELVSTLVVYCISLGLLFGALISLGFKVILLHLSPK